MAGYIGKQAVVLSTTAADVKGTVTADGVSLGDSDAINLGDGNDLQLYHDGSNSYIYDGGTGYMVLMSNGPGIRLNSNTAEVMVDATPNGAVSLYYDNASKLATTSTGVSVTGNVTATGDFITDEGKVKAERVEVENDTGPNMYATAYGTGSTTYTWFEGTGDNKLISWGNNGDISFYDDNGSTVGLRWDASANRLGIGITSPAYDLDVRGTNLEGWIRVGSPTATNDAGLRFAHAGTNHGVLYHDGDTDSLIYYDNIASAERMRIDSSGKVGIGTSSPETDLTVDSSVSSATPIGIHIGGNNAATPSSGVLNLISNNNHGDILISSNAYVNASRNPVIATTHNGMGATGIKIGGNGSHDLRFYTQDANVTAGTEVTNVERMRIDSSGRVTIPNQPAFAARGKGSVGANSSGYVVMPTVDFDNNSNYNTTNGRFTAPVTGKYQFNACILMRSPNTSSYGYLRFYVNGVAKNPIMHSSYNNDAPYEPLSFSYIISLSAGDYVNLYMAFAGSADSYGSSYDSFSGHLIG